MVPKSLATNHFNKRNHIRFHADPMDYAEVDFANMDGPFKPSAIALISEEAPMGGCGLIVIDGDKFVPEMNCRVKVGKLAPLKARVVWRKDIDSQVSRIGLQFME